MLAILLGGLIQLIRALEALGSSIQFFESQIVMLTIPQPLNRFSLALILKG